MQRRSGKASTNNFSVPEEHWVYCRGYPYLINEILLFPLPRKRWDALEKRLLEELQRRAEAPGTSPEFELMMSARGSLSLVLSRGFETKVSGDLDKDRAVLLRTLRREVSLEVCKDILGDHYWRWEGERDVGQGLEELLQFSDEEREEGWDISKLLRASGLSKLEKRLASQLSLGCNIAEASRRLKINPSTGRTLLQRIREKVAKFTGTVAGTVSK